MILRANHKAVRSTTRFLEGGHMRHAVHAARVRGNRQHVGQGDLCSFIYKRNIYLVERIRA